MHALSSAEHGNLKSRITWHRAKQRRLALAALSWFVQNLVCAKPRPRA
jgi:hypothetical protein